MGNPALVNGMMNADQWNYFRNRLHPPDLTPAQFGAAFSDPSAQRTAADFVAQLKTAGLAGVGLGSVTIPVPVLVNQNGRRTVLWATRTLENSSDIVRSYVPRGHPFVTNKRANYRRVG